MVDEHFDREVLVEPNAPLVDKSDYGKLRSISSVLILAMLLPGCLLPLFLRVSLPFSPTICSLA